MNEEQPMLQDPERMKEFDIRFKLETLMKAIASYDEKTLEQALGQLSSTDRLKVLEQVKNFALLLEKKS